MISFRYRRKFHNAGKCFSSFLTFEIDTTSKESARKLFYKYEKKNPNAGNKFRKARNVLQREATALPLAEKEILACHWLDFFSMLVYILKTQMA